MSNWKWFFTVVGLTSVASVVLLLLMTDDPYWEDRAKKLQTPSDDSVD